MAVFWLLMQNGYSSKINFLSHADKYQFIFCFFVNSIFVKSAKDIFKKSSSETYGAMVSSGSFFLMVKFQSNLVGLIYTTIYNIPLTKFGKFRGLIYRHPIWLPVKRSFKLITRLMLLWKSFVLTLTVKLIFGCYGLNIVHIRSYAGLYFPAFGLNTERYTVSLLRIQSEYGKMRTKITPNTSIFYTGW